MLLERDPNKDNERRAFMLQRRQNPPSEDDAAIMRKFPVPIEIQRKLALADKHWWDASYLFQWRIELAWGHLRRRGLVDDSDRAYFFPNDGYLHGMRHD